MQAIANIRKVAASGHDLNLFIVIVSPMLWFKVVSHVLSPMKGARFLAVLTSIA